MIDDHGAAIGIEQYVRLGEGNKTKTTYIASIFIDGELSRTELFRRSIAEVVRIAGDSCDVIVIRTPDSRALNSKRFLRRYDNVILRRSKQGMFSTVELAYDALRRASEGRKHLTIEEDLSE